jgi:hypothetical protein
MQPDLMNLYIARLLKEIEELTKSRLLTETQLQYTQSLNAVLNEQIKELELAAEKQSKRINKKEVNTSDTTF